MSTGPDESRGLAAALAQIPGGLFVLTSTFEGRRSGVLVRWVQPCSSTPPMVMVALATGQPVEPLIRDSRCFTLSQIGADDRFLIRKFNGHNGPPNGAVPLVERDLSEDPLLPLMTRSAPSGCPIIDRALCYFDCEVVRHVELDADHRIYVGQVHRGGVLNPGAPAIRYGSTYFNRNVNVLADANGSGNKNNHVKSSDQSGVGGESSPASPV